MLQAIRDGLTGWVVWFIVGLICIPFAFVGIESFRTGGSDPVVAKVGSQEITQAQLSAGFDQRYRQLQALLGENFRPEMFDQTRFRATVLQDMAQEALLRQYAQDAGFRASDAALFNYLRTIPVFQRDGQFSTEAYKAALSRQGLTPERFESQLRSALEIDQMREAVIESAFVTAADAAQAWRLAQQTRELTVLNFEASRYLAAVKVSDEEIAARYERDKARFTSPERIQLAYIELAQADLARAEPPSSDVLRVLYDAEKASRLTTPEERKARHILVSFGDDKDAARQKIEALAARLKQGTSFAELARTESQDPGSKDQGGDLGWIKRGQMVERFESALFALQPGEISAPVETEFGFHLIRLDELKAARTRAFEDAEVQRELTELYLGRERERRFQELQEQLEVLAFENPASLEPAAKALDLQIRTTGWFQRSGAQASGIAADDGVRAAAFSAEVLEDGENSKLIALEPGRVVVIRKADYEPERQKALDEVAEQITQSLREEAARARALEAARSAAQALREGGRATAVARDAGARLQTPGWVGREQSGVDPAVLERLFRLPRPQPEQSVVAEVALASGDVSVVMLTGVRDPGPADAQNAEFQRLRAQLRDQLAGTEFNGYRGMIEDRIKVKFYTPPPPDAEPLE
jgi:peptidyl-prolyl cis-trans isomerase D